MVARSPTSQTGVSKYLLWDMGVRPAEYEAAFSRSNSMISASRFSESATSSTPYTRRTSSVYRWIADGTLTEWKYLKWSGDQWGIKFFVAWAVLGWKQRNKKFEGSEISLLFWKGLLANRDAFYALRRIFLFRKVFKLMNILHLLKMFFMLFWMFFMLWEDSFNLWKLLQTSTSFRFGKLEGICICIIGVPYKIPQNFLPILLLSSFETADEKGKEKQIIPHL